MTCSTKISTRRLWIFLAATALAIGITTQAHAEKCTGKWGGTAATSVEFKGGKKVRYCYEGQCWNQRFSGSKDSKLKFPVGFSGAFVTLFKRDGNKYHADYKHGSNEASATYACR